MEKNNSSIAFQVLALGDVSSKELLQIVDTVIDYVKSQIEEVHVGPFETTLVGNFNHLMDVVTQAIELAGTLNDQIFVNMKVNYKGAGEVLGIDEKINKHH